MTAEMVRCVRERAERGHIIDVGDLLLEAKAQCERPA
jgi:hypothetical protein